MNKEQVLSEIKTIATEVTRIDKLEQNEPVENIVAKHILQIHKEQLLKIGIAYSQYLLLFK